MISNNMEKIPEIGKEYNFYDDGKVTESRKSVAKVVRIITPEEAKNILFERKNYEYDYAYEESLYDIWKEEIDNHRQGDNFTVIGKGIDTTPGKPWLYAEDTDYFVECCIPEYDENNIWFVRTVSGGWFSMDIQSSWQSGKLDVENKYKL